MKKEVNKEQPKVNYQKILEKILLSHEEKGEKPSLFLHSCCGPCSSYVLEYLSRYFVITLFYYNPNIFPKEEYIKRLETQREIIERMNLPVTFIEGTYEPDTFLQKVKGLEKEKEGGKRCEVCFALRLGETAQKAKEGGFDYVSTTLSVSTHKNAQVLQEIGENLQKITGVQNLPADFKKAGGYQKSVALAKKHGLYRQEYCGCPFSMREEVE